LLQHQKQADRWKIYPGTYPIRGTWSWLSPVGLDYSRYRQFNLENRDRQERILLKKKYELERAI